MEDLKLIRETSLYLPNDALIVRIILLCLMVKRQTNVSQKVTW